MTQTARTLAEPAPSRSDRIQIVRSPGGIVAWLTEDYAVPLIAMDFAFRGGAAQDPADKAGLAALLAATLDEGAGPHDSAAFHAALDDHAIHLHFDAGSDWLSGHLQTLTRNSDAAFDLLRLAVCEARFDEEPVERVKSQLASIVKRDVNDPDAIAARLFRSAAFDGHPYGQPPRGDLDTLARLTREDLFAHRARLMARDTLIVAVVGAISADELAARLDSVFGALPAAGALKPVPPVTMAQLGETIVHRVDTPQSAIRFGRPGIDRADPDFMAAMVANHILGGGIFTARLFREVREKRGLAYSVYSQLRNYDQAALLAGGTSTKNERAAESIAVIKEQIADLGAIGPTAEELEKAKKYLIGSYALNFDTSTKIAGQLLFLQQEGLTPAYLDERNGMIAAVSEADVKRVSQRLFGDGALLVTVAGQPEGL